MISITVLLLFIIAFVIAGIAVNKHNKKKDKYDLLTYFTKNKNKLSITLKENGQDTLSVNSDKKYPLASTLKIIIAYHFVKRAMNNQISLTDKVKLDELDKFYIPNTDGAAHPNWKDSIGYPTEISLLEVAKGMMQFSSNACTDFLIERIGANEINKSIAELQLDHDKIAYFTPTILIPGYLADNRNQAKDKLDVMDQASYQELSMALFQKMKANKTDDLMKKARKMLSQKVQLLMTNKMPSSTTKQYADLMIRLGNELLTKREKNLFSEILIGEKVKNHRDDYLWYKGGSTLFVLTSALYKESQDTTTSVSVFIKDDTGGELYWIRNAFNDFVISIATDQVFRKKVKEALGPKR
jgi:D-alanyl-D-alanine carboxypeptidase